MTRVDLIDEFGVREATVYNDTGYGFDHLLAEYAQQGKLLGYINAVGDTVFNQLQMDDFLADWTILIDATTSSKVRDFLIQVQNLAVQCRDHVHLYLKLFGE